MPLIEELPVTQTHRPTHGWAYVPVADPSIPNPIAATVPGSRKRGRDGAIIATATAKQQKAVQARLDSLDKENYKDGVTLAIPARAKSKRDGGKKTTPNVRRILTSQRAFTHYLADEEALGGGTTTTTSDVTQQQQAQNSAKVDGRKRDPVTGARRGRPPNSEREREKEKVQPSVSSTPKSTIKQEDKDKDKDKEKNADTDTVMTDTPTTTSTPSTQPKPSTSLPQPKPTTSDSTTNPLLLTTNLPKPPSSRVMSLLLSEPPLPYLAARAKMFPKAERPVRKFCGVCGYFGKVRCRKCGEWNCGGLECWRGHAGVCVAVGVY